MRGNKGNVKNKSKEVCCCPAEQEAVLVNRAKQLLKYVLPPYVEKQAEIKQRDVRGRHFKKFKARS